MSEVTCMRLVATSFSLENALAAVQYGERCRGMSNTTLHTATRELLAPYA
jgi:hypothetical protein